MKLLLLLIGCFLFTFSVFSQLPTGYFSGGHCTDDGGDFCGAWYIAADSSFFLISSNQEGYLKKIGKGKVLKYKDSIINLEFDNDFDLPSRLNFNYYSDSRNRPDSIYLNLKFLRIDKKKLSEPLMVHYGDQYLGLVQGNGIFKKTISKIRNMRYGTLYISGRTGADPIQFFLNLSTNYHEIITNISGEDSAYCRSIGLSYGGLKKDSLSFRIRPLRSGRYYLDEIVPEPNKKIKLLLQLQTAKIKQKYLTPILDDFIHQIKTSK